MKPQTWIYKKWSHARRLQAAFELYQLAREIIKTREKRANPTLSEQELEGRVRSFFR